VIGGDLVSTAKKTFGCGGFLKTTQPKKTFGCGGFLKATQPKMFFGCGGFQRMPQINSVEFIALKH